MKAQLKRSLNQTETPTKNEYKSDLKLKKTQLCILSCETPRIQVWKNSFKVVLKIQSIKNMKLWKYEFMVYVHNIDETSL